MRSRKGSRKPATEEEKRWVESAGGFRDKIDEYVLRQRGSWEDSVLLWIAVRDSPYSPYPYWNLFDAVEAAYPYLHYVPEKGSFDVEKERARMKDLRILIVGMKGSYDQAVY